MKRPANVDPKREAAFSEVKAAFGYKTIFDFPAGFAQKFQDLYAQGKTASEIIATIN